MKKTLIIKTGDTFPEISSELMDFEDWIARGLNIDPSAISVVDVPRGQHLPEPLEINGVVIAGSHAMVTQDLDWSVKIEKWLPGIVQAKIPVLGICYGHQLLAKAMGGKVAYHPGGLEIGTTGIQRTQDAEKDMLFKEAPDRFDVHVCHSQTVVDLPNGAVLLAANDFEPHHAFRIGAHAWGVQFHPEYDETIMSAYATSMEDNITTSGQTLADILANISQTPVAAEILKRFGKLVVKGE